MTVLSWQWLAGFFDGEGSINLKERSGTHWSVAQAHARGIRVLNEVKEFLAENGIPSALYTRKGDGCHCLYVSQRELVNQIVAHLMPYLRVKKTEAQDIVRFHKLFPSRTRGPALGIVISENRRTGITHRGEDHCRAKLKDEQVLEIRKLLSLGETKKGLARKFGMGATTIDQIAKRKTWTHLP